MLVHVVGIEQRNFSECREQFLGDGLDQLLGVTLLAEVDEARRGLPAPVGEELGRLLLECGEFGMTQNGEFHVGERQLEVCIAGAVRRVEEDCAHAG